MDKKLVIKSVMDAIVASGKKFVEIPKESFYNFFKGEGIEKKHWESLYSELENIYKPKKKETPMEMVSGFVTLVSSQWMEHITKLIIIQIVIMMLRKENQENQYLVR